MDGSTQVPDLVLARPLVDALAWRGERGETPPDPRIGLVTDGASRLPAAALRDAGLDVAGLLGPDALESIAWAAEADIGRAYADLPALLSDAIDAVAIDMPAPRCDVLVASAAEAGLRLLLTTPRVSDPVLLTEALLRLEDGGLTHTVAFLGRADPAYAVLAAHRERLGAVSQLTALHWPAGGPPRAELVDLVRRVCGEIAAVCADPAAMPAPELAADEPVTLALLTETGTTVLAAERFASRQGDALLTLVGDGGRLVLRGPVLTSGGEPVAVRRSRAGDAVTLAGRGLVHPDVYPEAATLPDLIAAGQVLRAVEISRADGGWVELD